MAVEPRRPEMVTVDVRAVSGEVSPMFLQGMGNRMTVSFFKYGPLADAYPTKVSALTSLQTRIAKYLETGNTEFLIDAANFAMIEFMQPSLPGAYFVGTDSDASPGRVSTNGAVTHASNDEIGAA